MAGLARHRLQNLTADALYERMYPPGLQAMIDHFESLSEAERRDELISMADAAAHVAPLEGEVFDLEDVRKDHECSDSVGVHLRVGDEGRVHLAVSLGCKVQTLTRALTVILCRGLEGCTLAQIRAVPDDFIVRVVGEQLVQLRARTIYYILRRIQDAAAQLQNHHATH